ncbi:response regulator transcription factor [Actinomadura meridiana]|uniref:Response regulator transcription factor n=1 Tax=Actinomadura meridiana TaxID=559626 RepID=A0ABP8CEJ0_9ACTN
MVEDDESQAELIRRYLEREGHAVVMARDGRSAIEEARRQPPDLVVLDVMLPGVDGLDVCRVLRRESEVAILMLTAKSTEDDLLLGLDLGADDYMTKPFSPRELVARVRTLLRRAPGAGPLLRVGGLTVDVVRHEVHCDGLAVDCTPGEFTLLAVLAAEPERVFTRAQLLERMHGFDGSVTERSIDVHVMNLRKKIEPRPGPPRRLVTVYGVGYKLTARGPDAG